MVYDVIIIGAGLAGLSAANYLIENGLKNIVILEARAEPGGRICSEYISGTCFELGAQWLHSNSGPLYNFAKGLSVLHEKESLEAAGIYVRDDGLVYDAALVDAVNMQVENILNSCKDFQNKYIYPRSVGEYLTRQFQCYINNCVQDSEDVIQLKKELFNWVILYQMIDNSCNSLFSLSAKDWGKYICNEDQGQAHINIKGGYASIINVLVENLPPSTIMFNTPIEKLDLSAQRNIKVNCQNTTLYCDHVIVTCSLGYLKDNMHKLFVPSLPLKYVTAINAMGFDSIGKIFLIFEEKWWSHIGYQLVWQKKSTLQKEDEWLKYISGFDTVFDLPNVLLGWVGGPGVSIMENLSEEIIGQKCVQLLRNFLKNEKIPYPCKVLRSKWASCPWIKGGYSFTTPLCDKLKVGPETLAEPYCIEGIPKVIFAGEAVHSAYFATTHGAYHSGIEQAKVLLNHIRERH